MERKSIMSIGRVWELQRSIETWETAPSNTFTQASINNIISTSVMVLRRCWQCALRYQLTPRANPLRAIQDGNHGAYGYHLWGAKVAFDIHRFEDGECRALGQCNNSSAANPSGRTMIDGECTLTDFNKTLENKALVSKFVNEVMIDRLRTKRSTSLTIDCFNITPYSLMVRRFSACWRNRRKEGRVVRQTAFVAG